MDYTDQDVRLFRCYSDREPIDPAECSGRKKIVATSAAMSRVVPHFEKYTDVLFRVRDCTAA